LSRRSSNEANLSTKSSNNSISKLPLLASFSTNTRNQGHSPTGSSGRPLIQQRNMSLRRKIKRKRPFQVRRIAKKVGRRRLGAEMRRC